MTHTAYKRAKFWSESRINLLPLSTSDSVLIYLELFKIFLQVLNVLQSLLFFAKSDTEVFCSLEISGHLTFSCFITLKSIVL